MNNFEISREKNETPEMKKLRDLLKSRDVTEILPKVKPEGFPAKNMKNENNPDCNCSKCDCQCQCDCACDQCVQCQCDDCRCCHVCKCDEG